MTNSSPPLRVVVVGAGIVGVSSALWLQREGLDVTLIDRNEPGDGTSYGNGGILASISVVPVTTPGLIRKAPKMLLDPDGPLFLKWGYLPRLAPWLINYLRNTKPERVRHIAQALAGIVGDSLSEHQALARGTPAERWIVPSDYLFVYRDRAAYEGDAFGWGLRRANGYTWSELDRSEFRAYDPAFSDDNAFAIRCPDHGHVLDPGAYVKDLARVFEANGGTFRRATLTDVVRDEGRVTAAVTDAATIPCDRIVLATGVWSKPLAAKLGVYVPLESERGYHLELLEPSVMPRAPCMVASGKFVMTPMEGRLRIAGLVEFGGLDAPPNPKAFELLRRNAKRALAGLSWNGEREWMGHRPAPADSIPVIGESPRLSGAYLAFGHHHIGLTGGPKTGRLIAAMIADKRPNIDLAPYSPARFN